MEVTITPLFKTPEIKRKTRAAQAAIEKATISALNKIATQGMTQGRKAITETYNIKNADVKPAFKLIRARKDNPIATIRARGDTSLPLFKFGGLPKAPVSQAGIPAPYKRRRKASAKVLKKGTRERFRHAFVAKMGSEVSIYERTTGKRLPVRKLRAIGIPAMFENVSVKAIDGIVRAKGQQIYEHEAGYYLDKAGVRRR